MQMAAMALLAQIPALIQTQTATYYGVGLGSVVAVVCSWQRNRSILWAILAGIFSWFYVVYFAVTRKPDEKK
jgi:branched-subunit amino acid transport protein